MRSCLNRMVCALCVLVFSAPINASVVYNYQGSNFNIFEGTAYDNTMSITVTMELAQLLEPNFDSSVTPITFTISDGINAITESTTTESTQFAFTTDSSGTITSWDVGATTPFPSPVAIGDTRVFINTQPGLDTGQIQFCGSLVGPDFCSGIGTKDGGTVFPNSGTWSVVPVPAAAWLFGSGLMGLIGISRRKKTAQ